MVWIVLWILAFLFVAFGTFVSAIVAFCVKGKWQRTCVDVLLVFATLVVAVGLSAMLLPKDLLEKEASKLSPAARLHQADFMASGLIGAEYVAQSDGLLKAISALDGLTPLKKENRLVLESVKNIAKNYPNDDELMTRLAILYKINGEDTTAAFEHYTRSGGKLTPLLSSLQALYSSPQTLITASQIDAIKAGLPGGWYRQTALAEAYKQTGNEELKGELAESERKSGDWLTKFAFFQVSKLLVTLTGIYVILATIKSRKDSGEFEPLAKDFRRMYAIMLSTLYAQVGLGILVGFCIGVNAALTSTPTNLSENKTAVELMSAASGIIAATITFYLLICRPNKISIRQAFMRGNQVTSLFQFAMLAMAGFAAMVTTNRAVHFVRSLLPAPPVGITNSAQINMNDSFFSLDYVGISWSVLFIFVLAPFIEELMFRGLLYGWLRHRFSVLVGVIGSALLFAAYHFDLPGFWQYFFIGIVLAVAYERSRSLLVTTAIHGMWNGWIILATALLVNR